jgi:hypothetical protein
MDADAKRKKPIAKLLQAASLDLDAARRLLVDPPNVLAANHLQQAAEKIISAVRLHRGLLNTKDHDLVILIDGRPGGEPRPLPEGDPWRDRFRPLEPPSSCVTRTVFLAAETCEQGAGTTRSAIPRRCET